MATTYRLTQGGVLMNGASFIPEAPGNRDWDAYTEWVAGGNTPDPTPPEDFRPEVMARLVAMRDQLSVAATGMQTDYLAAGDSANALICRDIKAQLKVIDSDPTLVAATTRAGFRSALRARLNAIAGSAPADVRDAIKQAAAAS